MSGDGADDAPRVHGVLCTYGRPRMAVEYLNKLDRQTRPPDVVYVIDNSSDRSLRASLAARPATGVPTVYVDPGRNSGPAGAFAVGFRIIESSSEPQDVVVHFDDDDPPVADDQLEQLLQTLVESRAADPRVAGIGLSGGVLRLRTGMINPGAGPDTLADADHLHGGYLPHYSRLALSSIGGNDETFFYGFEELELGRRLHLKGWRLLVDTQLARVTADRYPKKLARTSFGSGPTEGAWSRFHKERNLIRILRRERLWTAIIFTVMARHVAKPLMLLVRSPRDGRARLVLGLRATLSGLRSEAGIDPRYPPPSA